MELPELITSLASRPGPVLTWYGESRSELGGGVAARWLAKTANLLAGDLAGDLFGDAAEPGSDTGGLQAPSSLDDWSEDTTPTGTIRVDLGCSWQSVTWLAAAWLSGWRSVGTGMAAIGEGRIDEGVAAPSVGGDGMAGAGTDSAAGPEVPAVDVWVSERIGPEHLTAAAEGCWVLAQATTPLALSWPGPLPEGVLDALAELAAQADALEIAPDMAPGVVVARADAADSGAVPLSFRNLTQGGDHRAEEPSGGSPHRVLVTSTNPVDDTRSILFHWMAGRSVVMVDPGVHGTEDCARIARVERAEELSC